MKIIQGDQLTFVRGLEHRGGTFHSIIMMEGEPGTIGNFQVSYGRIGGDFFSPRHRHNFEQIRYQVEGALDFARDGKLEEGMIGYFPEGVAYGPQTQSEGADVATIVLQCGGASGSGYLSQDEVRAGVAALRTEGEFKDGVFRRHPGISGKRNVDGYQAIWEHVNGRPMKYPEPRYSRPFMMNPAHYSWVPLEQAAGVSEKMLGVFTERRSSASFLKFSTGARHYAFGRAVFVVLSGSGRAGDQPLRRLTTLYLDRGERLNLEAGEGMEVLQLGLPNVAGLQQRTTAAPAMAAE
ncbi:MAG TPA: hypothetical protein VH020_00620 [Stellaceae bacterium]|jgi:hypothetical protein|nr:hypothetical protein [Stellaceae bacterium]